MLCCRKRPPSPNEKAQRKTPPREALEANAPKTKSKTPPPSSTNGHTLVNSAASPEAVVLKERAHNAEAGAPKKKSPSREKSPSKSPQKRTPSPTKGSPKKAPSPSKSPQKSPSPAKESPKKKASSPTREAPPQKAASPTRKSPDKGKASSPVKTSPPRQVAASPTKAGSPDRSSAASISDYLRRLETTTDLDTLLSEGKTLLAEAKAKQAAGGHSAKMSGDLSNLIARLEAVTTRLENVSTKGGGASEESLAAAVQAFDDVVNGPFAEYITLSNKIGGVVANQAGLVNDAVTCEREFLIMASKAREPDSATLQKLLTPMSQKISAVQDFREQNRANKDHFNHLSVLSEAIGALGWIAVSPAPGPYVKEMSDAGQFYSNRVLKEFKEKDKTHVEWVRAWTKALTELQAFVKKHHTTGVVWNKQGVDASTLSTGGAAPPPPAGGPPPPPPPGPPPPPFVADDAPSKGDDSTATRNALFADLNKGASVTSGLKRVPDSLKTHKNPGLRKVKDEEKTHKNAALRLQSPVPYKAAASSPKTASKKPAAIPDKPPKTQLDGKKWIIEYHKDNKNIVLDDVNMKQQVYVYRCTNSTIQVKGKVNSIVLDNCKKTALVLESVVAAVEAINCQSVQAQVQGNVPTVSVDKTDGFQLYLSQDSLKAEIVTAKSSELNILVPQPDGEYKEYALPEQFKSLWTGSGFKTETTDING